MTAVSFSRVARRFGDVRAVDDVSFDVAEGEFFALLGPSGSGKTTCLRLIAGFERPDAGDVLIDGARVNDVPPYDRPVNTVFQDYALFPHLSVADNVAYSLMLRRVPRAERRQQADGMLEMVKLSGLGDRKPGQLSGGQRQRVAVARALINRPKILLLDEPLGALDLKLREAMQIELKSLQRQLGITFVFVTHDQGEALSMADRIAVFNSGRIEQIGASREVYDRPATAFVADFVGGSNVLVGAAAERITGRAGAVSIRPERVRLLAPGSTAPDAVLVDGEVEGVFFLGGTTRASVRTDGGDALAVAAPSLDASGAQLAASLGHRVRLALPHADFWPVRE